MRDTCTHGHPQRGPADHFPDGQCRHCDRDNVRRYRARVKAAIEVAKILEAAGAISLDTYVK